MDERVQRVSNFIAEKGIKAQIIEFKKSTKNSKLAAQALNCPVAQIAKSIVFMGNEPMIIILSGDRRVELEKLAKLLGVSVSLADAETVLRSTGFPIGGVPPFAHIQPLPVMLDKSIERFEEVYAAAGASNAILKIGLEELKESSRGRMVDVAQ